MALSISITIPALDIKSFEKKILHTYADEIKKELASRTPGNAKALWTYTDTVDEVLITNKSHYLSYIERGTGLYGPGHTWIIPKQANVLSWMDGNKRIFAKRTRGMKAQPFVKQAVSAGLISGKEAIYGNV